MKNKYIVFDLDDTLADEIKFLKSAYLSIAQKLDRLHSRELFEEMFFLYRNGENVFKALIERYHNYRLSELLKCYRQHYPDIDLNDGAEELLLSCQNKGCHLGLITDGRSLTQRNKLKALGIEEKFNKILISEEFGSEKPNQANFKTFEREGDFKFYYIGDNTKKDFIAPNQLGWETICLLDAGKNIHPQDFELPSGYLPKYKVNTLREAVKMLI